MDQTMVKVGDASLDCFGHGTRTAIRTVRVNPRGAGNSTGPVTGLTLHDLASDVAGVIEALEAPEPLAKAIIAFAR